MWSPVRMRTRSTSLAASLLLLAACSKKTEPGPGARQGAAPPVAAASFSMRDLAAATALDARLARFSLVASDVEAALRTPAATRVKAATADAARKLLPELQAAYGEAERARAGIAHAGDRAVADAAVAAAKAYSGKLAASDGADAAALAPERLSARDAFGAAVAQYRAARSRWRLDAPEPRGVEREFAEARREMERAESALGSRTRVAPREAGHELDPSSAQVTGVTAAARATSTAERLPSPLREPAARYAAAEAEALDAVARIGDAAEADRPAIARRYHAAKADALLALADYFAALSAR